tara:strand:- start:83 stop:310 length:228 start_codon:yes stop_codon:yes gene_type:complete
MSEEEEIIIKLVEEVKKLRSYVKDLEDENESLWFILDELDGANIDNSSKISKKSQETLAKDQLSLLFTSTKVGKA